MMENVLLLNNVNSRRVWFAWRCAADRVANLDFVISFQKTGLKAFVINDYERMIMLDDTNRNDPRFGFDLTEITDSSFGQKVIAGFKDHKFGQNPVNYAAFK